MATDSTILPQGEAHLDSGMDMSGSELDLTAVQLAQTEPADYVDLPKGNTVILLPVQPGQTVRLPTASPDSLLAKIGPEGNLAIVVDGRTIILQGFVKANDQSPVKVVTNDGDSIDVADLVAATDPSLDIQTAAGPAAGGQGDGAEGSGIYIPFVAGPGLGGLDAIGILDPTALQYRLIDDERREDPLGDTEPSSIDITFDILGGIVNEDDLPTDENDAPNDVQALKLVVKDVGNDGTGNDPFDSTDREQGGVDSDGDDGYPDPDREPLVTVATVKVNFGPDTPGTLSVDPTQLPSGLTSEGEAILYAVLPPGGGQGNGIVGFVDNNSDGKFDGGDRLVFEVKVQEDKSNSEFHVAFTLHDNIDNAAPDLDKNGKADLLGADEQILDLPVKITAKDSDGSTKSTTMNFGVEDDIPFFGEVVIGEGIEIINTAPGVAHDESLGVDGDADDQTILSGDALALLASLNGKVTGAGFSLPFGDSAGALDFLGFPVPGLAQTQVFVSFGADRAAVFKDGAPGDDVRDSVHGALSGSGENEHPFELFMIANGSGGAVTEGNLTIAPQQTNATVTWNGQQPPLPVMAEQIDAHTIVGYVEVNGVKETVFVVNIDDSGVLSFVQLHQINHGDTTNHDEPFQIKGADGQNLVHIRATDFDGDHATQPVNIVVQDDGPKFIKVFWGFDGDGSPIINGVGLIDEDKLPNGIKDGPGDGPGGTSADGQIFFAFGADEPGTLSIGGIEIKDSAGNIVAQIDANGNFVTGGLKTADGRDIQISKSGPDGNGIVTWTGIAVPGNNPAFTFTLDTAGGDQGEFEFELHLPLEHPFTDADSKNDGPQTAWEDNLNFDFTIIGKDVDGDTASGTIKITVDDDSPKVLSGEGSLKLAMDESFSINFKDYDDPNFANDGVKDGSVVEADALVHALDTFFAGLGFPPFTSGAAKGNVAGLFSVGYGADGPGDVSYALTVLGGGVTGLTDTATQTAITLVQNGNVVEGRDGHGNLVFAIAIDPDSGDIVSAQYRAIDHGDEEGAPGAHDEVAFLAGGALGVTATATDADGDSHAKTIDIGGSITFDDDGPKFVKVFWGFDGDGSPIINGVGQIDEDALPNGISGGPGDDSGGKSVDGEIFFDFGSDGAGHLSIDSLNITDATGATIATIDGDGNFTFGSLKTADGRTVDVNVSVGAGGVITYQGVAVPGGDPVFTLTLDGQGADLGEFEFELHLPLEHPFTDADSKNNGPQTAWEDNLNFDFTVRGTDGDGDSDTGHIKIRIDDDSPKVLSGEGSLKLAMDESFSVNFKDYDDPNFPDDGVKDGSVVEADALVHFFDTLFAGLGFPPFTIGAAKGNVAGLFSVNYGADGPGDVSYALTVLGGGVTGLKDTATQTAITLVQNGNVVEGRDGHGNLVFAVAINPDTGDIVSAQYRAIDHGAEEGTPGAHDEVAFLAGGALGVTATATDADGDSHAKTVDIGGSISFDDDGPKFKDVNWGHDNDSSSGVGIIDEDKLSPNGNNDNAPGDNSGGTQADGQILFDFGSDQPGTLTIDALTVTNSLGQTVAVIDGAGNVISGALRTADGRDVAVTVSVGAGGVITYQGVVAVGEQGAGTPVFTLTLDGAGGGIGNFNFVLHQPLEHPFTDSDSQNNGPDTAFEDNLNFDFTVRGTDGDGDSDTGHIKIRIDDDSPVTKCDVDCVVEGKNDNVLNSATGNVVNGDGSTVFGNDANNLDGVADKPGADQPYTISKLAHGGNVYTLSADGTTVLKNGSPLNGTTETFDGKILKIPTAEGGTFEIVMTSNTLGEVGDYKYTVPENAKHKDGELVGPATLTESQSFGDGAAWATAFAAEGVTLTAIGGTLASKTVDVNPKGGPLGAEDYGGVGVSNSGDEPEVDINGPDEQLQLEFATPTDNATLLIGALFDGNQFDAGNQEILLWQVYDAADNLVASGQILGSDNGLVTLDIDTNGVAFDRIVLTPVSNGAGNSNNNSDFLLINVKVCTPEDKFQEQFDYTLRDADGDESTSTLKIDVKDTEPTVPTDGCGTLYLTVDEDGLPAGIGDDGVGASPNDAPGNSASTSGFIPFTPGADPVKIELSVGNGGDTGLKTLAGQTVLAAWDAESSTLIGYIAGTDPSDAANQVFKMTVTNHQTGAVDFQLLKPIKHADGGQDDNTENAPDPFITVDVQIEDKDCDVAYTTVKVTIDDDMPVIGQGSGAFALAVDESLDGNTTPNNAGDHPHNPGTRIEDDEDGAGLPGILTGLGSVIGASKSGAAGLFSFNPGADGLQSAVYTLALSGSPLATGLIDSQSGTAISLHSMPDGTVRGISASGHLVFALSIDGNTGEVSMAQYRAINHGGEEQAPGNHDEVKLLGTGGLSVTLTVTDKDGDTVSSSVDITGKVTFDDDGPKADIDKKHDNEVLHDESAGLQNDDRPNGSLPLVFSNVDLIGWARSGDPVVTTSGSDYGQDGAGTTVLSLKVSAPGVDSGLDDTATGNNILLFQNGDIVEGRVQGSNELVFAVSLNQDGTVDVAQYRAIEHPDDDDHDEDVGISHDALQAWVTITDKDGDSATDSVSIGSRVRFDDDGPVADIDIKHDAVIILDESKDAAAGDGFPDGNANDEAGNVANDIAYAKVLGSSLFTDNSSFGTDGPGTKSYSLVLSNNLTYSGLVDSATNDPIYLVRIDATTIEGRVDTSGPDPLAFRITIDPVTGDVTVSQFRAVEHNNAGSSASDHDEPGGSAEVMDLNKLFVRQTITDGDKDHDSDEIDLGKIIKFEDDGPIARNDVDSLDPIAGSKFESQGNVITGSGVTTPGIDDGGTDVPWTISNLVGSKSSDSNPSGGFNVTGTYGTLSMNSSGQYTYNFDEANTGKVASGSTEVFTYTLRDSDGDTDTATLTISFGEATVETRAVVNPETGGCVPEDAYAPIALTAVPGAGDIVTQITLSNVPNNWDVAGPFAIVPLGASIVGAPVFDPVTHSITFNVTGAPAGAPVTITAQIKGAPDSDANGLGLTVGATVVDGVVFAQDTTNFDVIVDAVADGDDKGDDGDADKLGVTIEVTETVADGNTSFQVGDTGNVKVTAAYDDFTDGSELHNLVVEAPAGFSFTGTGTLPPGVSVVLQTPTSIQFAVDSKSGDGQDGVGDFELNIPVTYTGGQPDGNSGNFSATVVATEVPTDSECDPFNNTDSATASDQVAIASVPTTDVRIGAAGNADPICVPEDSDGVAIPVEGSTTAGSHLTSIVISGFPTGPAAVGWTFDFSGLDTGANVSVDDSQLAALGQVTINFGPGNVTNYTGGTFTVSPPDDSDVDLGTLTAVVNAVSDVDPTVTDNDSDTAYVRVDAVADGKDDANGGDGDANVLSVSIAAADSGDAGDKFSTGELGTLTLNATFDDFKDGSEAHQITITAPAGFEFTGNFLGLGLPAGVTADPASTPTSLILNVDSKDGDGINGVGSIANLQIEIKNVSAPSGTTANFTATATAEETPTDQECNEDNNSQSVEAQAEVQTKDNQIPVAYDDKKCGDEAGPKNANLLLVFDNSGSMADPSGIPGVTKLQAAKQAAINMLNAYAETGGDVRVMLVTFNSNSDREEVWLNLADAIEAINDIPQSNSTTNYEAAILDAIAGFNDTDGRGNFATHDNFVYFLSDGEPTTGGNPGDNSITDGTLTSWDNLLENPANQIDHVYAVGLGTGIPGGANNPNLIDVARPDGNNNAPNTVILVDDFNDLSATLTGTVGSLNEGNVLDGSIENDLDAPAPNTPDFQGDGPAHVSYLEYNHASLNDLDIKVTWDGVNPLVVDGTANGANLVVNGTKVSFDTEHGRMTFDFSNGDYDFIAGSIDGGDKEEHFTYKITDDNGDQSNPADLTVCIKDVFVDKTPITYDDVVSGTEPAPKNANLLLVFDNSGSMADPAGFGGLTKLQAAKQAAISLLNSYAATGGDVRVMLVTFNSDAGRQAVWLDIAAAITAINAIPQSSGSTDYQDAIAAAIDGFNDVDGRGDTATHDGFVYFLSDGQPTTGGNGSGGTPAFGITPGTLTTWNTLLENDSNNIDHVYSVGFGGGIPDGASNVHLISVANPDNDAAPGDPNGTVLFVDNVADLAATLEGTVGTEITGNILDGTIENDPDAPGDKTADNQGDGPAHLSYFEYDSANNDLDIKISWDGAGAVVVDGVANGRSTVVNGKEVSFDTDHGRMTIDFSDGDFKLVAGPVSGGDKTEVFDYKITDSDGDVSNTSELKVTIENLPGVVTIGDATVNEGGSANVQVNLSEAAPVGGVTVHYTFQTKVGNTANGGGTDYNTVTSSIFIAAGATSGLIPVNAVADAFFEGNETYSVVITGVTGGSYTVGDDTGLITIIDKTTLDVPINSHSIPDLDWVNVSGKDFDNDGETGTGGSGADGFDGEGGDDTLNGNGGNDHLFGEDDDDILNGGNDHDFLEGGDNDDTLNGGAGNDRLSGGADFDKYDGGSGDDWIEVDSADLGVGRSINGGDGNDVLDIGNVDLTGSTGITNIEVITMEPGSDADTLTLSAADVLAVTDADDILFIWGDSNDTVSLTGGGWTKISGIVGDDGSTYNRYTNGGATVFVEAEVITNT